MMTTTCGFCRLEVGRQLRRPIEVVGPRQPGAHPAVERGADDAGVGQVGLQRRRRGRCRWSRRRSGRAAGWPPWGPSGRAAPSSASSAPCPPPWVVGGGLGRLAPGCGPDTVSPVLPPDRPLPRPGDGDEVGELQGAADGGDRARHVEAHRAPRPDRRHLGVVLQGGRVQQEPEGEGGDAEAQHASPRQRARGRRRRGRSSACGRATANSARGSQSTWCGGVRASAIRSGSR